MWIKKKILLNSNVSVDILWKYLANACGDRRQLKKEVKFINGSNAIVSE